MGPRVRDTASGFRGDKSCGVTSQPFVTLAAERGAGARPTVRKAACPPQSRRVTPTLRGSRQHERQRICLEKHFGWQGQQATLGLGRPPPVAPLGLPW